MPNIGLRKSESISNNWLFSNIEIKMENITTNPPISKRVLIAERILFASNSPMLERDSVWGCGG